MLRSWDYGDLRIDTLVAPMSVLTNALGLLLAVPLRGGIPGLPGNFGTFEASAVAMLALFRVPVEVGLTATLLLRGFTYWLPMAPGFWLSRRELKGGRRERS